MRSSLLSPAGRRGAIVSTAAKVNPKDPPRRKSLRGRLILFKRMTMSIWRMTVEKVRLMIKRYSRSKDYGEQPR